MQIAFQVPPGEVAASQVLALGGRGGTVLFSSYILEEVERAAAQIEVMVAGRLAASGDHRRIRRLMTDRPPRFTVRSSDDRRLAATVLADPSAVSAKLGLIGLNDLTEALGGRISIDSPRGAGTTLRAELPLTDADAVPQLTRSLSYPPFLLTWVAGQRQRTAAGQRASRNSLASTPAAGSSSLKPFPARRVLSWL